MCVVCVEVLFLLFKQSQGKTKQNTVISTMGRWTILECHCLLRHLAKRICLEGPRRVFSHQLCFTFFPDTLPSASLYAAWQSLFLQGASYTNAAFSSLCYPWCFNPTAVQSWSEGRPFKIIEFSNWNFKSNWEEMRAFPIWKASAQVFFFP